MRSLSSLLLLLLLSCPAHADIFEIWAAGKVDYTYGTGDIYKGFDQPYGLGAEGGLELLYIDLWGEALVKGDGQYLFTLNLGFDLDFGDDFRFLVGLYTGPMFFMYPEQEAQMMNISPALKDQIFTATGNENLAGQLEEGYNKQAAALEAEYGRFATGWNLLRLRLNLEFKLAPFLYMGADAMMGYHYILSGEDVAAGIKNEAIKGVVKDHNELQTKEGQIVVDALREELGADAVDAQQLDGMNWNLGIFLKLEI